MTPPAQGSWASRYLPQPQVAGWTALLTLCFALGHTLFPLYGGDQLIYFLNGLARAGYGFLDRDWAASVTNVYPFFTWLVYATYRLAGAGWFYVYLLVFMGVYICALSTIAARAAKVPPFGGVFLVAAAAVVMVHSDGFDRLLGHSGILRGNDFWYGVAGQYLIHPEFVPSTFGVLLLPAIALFLAGKARWSAVLVAVAVTFHPAIAFVGAALVAAFMWVTWKSRGQRREALIVGALALVLVLPSVIWSWLLMQPTNPQAYMEAREIFRFVRTPESQNPAEWVGFSTLVKLVLVGAAIWLVRRSELAALMLISLAAGAVFTLLQVATDSADIALLVPWRVLVWLVPLSSAILLFHAARAIGDRPKPLAFASAAILLSLVGLFVYLGAMKSIVRFESGPENNKLQEMFAFVRDNKQPGDLYLLPVRREHERFEHFRLASGARLFVDFKVFPVRDVDIIEWETRMRLARRFYTAGKAEAPAILAFLVARYGVTHVMFDRNHPMEPAGILEPVHRNSSLMLFRVSDRFREQAREALRRPPPAAPRAPAASGQVLPG